MKTLLKKLIGIVLILTVFIFNSTVSRANDTDYTAEQNQKNRSS